MHKTIFITGANRSIGLEFVRQYANADHNVIATCRDPLKADELQALANNQRNINIEQLDVADENSVDAVAKKYEGQAIDSLINNAGVMHREQASFLPFNKEGILKDFETNFFGTLRLTSRLLPNLLKSTNKHIITLTTKVSSMADNRSGGNYGYRCSKIALNMAMKNIAIAYRDQGVRVILIHPGWVKTPMGGPSALIDARASVTGIREVISKRIENSMADFYEFNGKVVPW